MRHQLALITVLLALVAGCQHGPSGAMAAAQAHADAQVETDVAVPNIARTEAAQDICRSAAEARGANWTGLFWTPRPGGASVCVMAARTHGARRDPVILVSSCIGDTGLRDECGLLGSTPTTRQERVRAVLKDRPTASARDVGYVEPTDSFVLLDVLIIEHFSHRGVFRSAWLDFPAGQVVFPIATGNESIYPWQPAPASGARRYSVMTYPGRLGIDISESNSHPDIAWETLPSADGADWWALVQKPGGSLGWADFHAFDIEFGESE